MDAIFERLTELWNSGNLELIPQVYSEDVERSDPNQPQRVRGTQAMAEYIAEVHTGFPDFELEITQQIGEADQVASEWICTGTHKGLFQGIPATGRRVRISGMTLNRIQGNKVVEERVYFDRVALLQQLGVAPAPSEARSAAR